MTLMTDYQAWRKTPGGYVHAALYPLEAEAVAEVRRTADPDVIRGIQDTHELTYGRRPSVAEARAVIDHGWERGQQITGTATQIQAETQYVSHGAFVIRNMGEPPHPPARMGADLILPPPRPGAPLPPGVAGL